MVVDERSKKSLLPTGRKLASEDKKSPRPSSSRIPAVAANFVSEGHHALLEAAKVGDGHRLKNMRGALSFVAQLELRLSAEYDAVDDAGGRRAAG